MSIRQLKARLDRLAGSIKETKIERRRLPFEFPIEPKLAEALWNDHKRLSELDTIPRFLERWRTGNWNDDTPEEIALRERIAKNAKKIKCPPSYGFKEFFYDNETLSPPLEELIRRQNEPSADNIEDIAAENAQVFARMEAFKQTPEGQARMRLEKLLKKRGWKSAAEHDEIERLMSVYPEPLASRDYRPSLETLRQDAERDRRIAEKNRIARAQEARVRE